MYWTVNLGLHSRDLFEIKASLGLIKLRSTYFENLSRGYIEEASSKGFILTKLPELGTEIDGVPQSVVDISVPIAVKEKITSTPGFPKAPRPFSASRFEVKRSSGDKGLGLFALTDFSLGELVIDERPLIIVPTAFTVGQFDESSGRLVSVGEEHLQRLLGMMEDDRRQALEALHNARVDESYGRISGIIISNGIQTQKFRINQRNPLEAYTGVSATISRTNHRYAVITSITIPDLATWY